MFSFILIFFGLMFLMILGGLGAALADEEMLRGESGRFNDIEGGKR